jgi:tetratricopeptide (TPR) repeat protein
MEEQQGLLAHHWEQAGERERAVDYLSRAGEQAAAQFANAEAEAYLSRALCLTVEEEMAERYSLLLARERLYDAQGARDVQRQDLAALQELAESLDDDRRRAEVALRQSREAHQLADRPAAVAAGRRAVHLARAVGDVPMEAEGYILLAGGLDFQGDYRAAQPIVEQALALARASNLRGVEAYALYGLGSSVCLHGDYAGSRDYLQQSLCIYRDVGDRRHENIARNKLAGTMLAAGAYDEGRAHIEQARQAFREIGDRWSEAGTLGRLGLLHHHLGDYARARAYLEGWLTSCHEVRDPQGVTYALADLGLLFHHMGEDETALGYAQQALKMAQDQRERWCQGESLICQGHALTSLSRLDEAGDAYHQALALTRELGQPHRSVDALAGLARVAMAQGDLRQAQGQVEEILSHQESGTLGGPLEPFRAHLTCYRVLRANADPRANGILGEARRLLQERAGKISDEEERRSYLNNVAVHREIVRAYAERE